MRHDRLTVVAGGPVIRGSEDLGRAALEMVDRLDADDAWGFESVAAALHQLVLDHEPRGVAAVLADDDGEVLLFAFDRATAQGGEAVAAGQGRSGWSTEVADGPAVQLRLDNVPFTPADTDIELRWGMVPGAGAILQVLPAPKAEVSTPGASPISDAVPSPKLSSDFIPAPPPPEQARVDSSLLPPPPGEWQAAPPVTTPGSTLPPPPAPVQATPPPPRPAWDPPPPRGTKSPAGPFGEDPSVPKGPPPLGD